MRVDQETSCRKYARLTQGGGESGERTLVGLEFHYEEDEFYIGEWEDPQASQNMSPSRRRLQDDRGRSIVACRSDLLEIRLH